MSDTGALDRNSPQNCKVHFLIRQEKIAMNTTSAEASADIEIS